MDAERMAQHEASRGRRGHRSTATTPTKQQRRDRRRGSGAEHFHPALASLSTPEPGGSAPFAGLSYTPVFSAPASPPFDERLFEPSSNASDSSDPGSDSAVQDLLDSVRRARQKVISHAARSGSPAEDDWVDMILAATPKRQIRFDGVSPATPRRRSDAVRQFHPALQTESERSERAERMHRSPDSRASEQHQEAGQELYDLHAWRELAAQQADRLRAKFDAAAESAEDEAEGEAAAAQRRRRSPHRAASPPAVATRTPTELSGRTPLTKAQRVAQRESRMGGIIKGFLSNALLSRMLAEWATFVRFQTRNRTILRKTAARLRRRQLEAMLLAWQAGIAAQREELALAVGAKLLIGRAVIAKELLSGWNSWRAFVKMRRAEKSAVLRKILNRRLHVAFASWQQRWQEKRRLEWLKLRTVKKLKQRFLGGAFAAWSHHSSETRRLKSSAHRVIQRLRHRIMCGAMDHWHAQATEIIRARQIVQRVVSRMKQRRFARAFGSWVEFASASVRQRHVLQKVVLRIKRMQLSVAWSGWSVSVSDGLRLRHAAKCVVTAMRHGAQSSAMAAWSDFAYDSKRLRKAATILMSVAVHYPLYRAFNAWCCVTLGGLMSMEHLENVLDETRLKLRHMRAEKAFELWYSHTLTKRASRDWTNKVAKHVVKIVQTNTLREWLGWATRQRQVRYVVHRAVCKLKSQLLSCVLWRWTDYHRRMKRLRAIILHHWCTLKRAVFGSWCEQVRCGYLKSCMRKRVIGAFKRQFMWRLMVCVFDVWEHWATHRRTIRRLVLKSIGRMKHLRAATVYSAWHDNAHARSVARRAVRWMQQRTTERRCARALSEWRAWKLQRHRNQSLMARMIRTRLEAVLHAWRGCVVVLRKFRRLLLRNSGRHAHWGLTCWVDFVREKKRTEFDLTRDFVLAWRQHTVAAQQERKNEAAASVQSALRQTMDYRVVSLFVHRWEQHRNSAVFTAWAAYTAHRHNKKIKLRKANHTIARCKRRFTLDAWRAWVLEGGRLWNVSSRRIRRVLRISFDAWRDKLHNIHLLRGVTARWAAKADRLRQQQCFWRWANCVRLTVTVRRMYLQCNRQLLREALRGFESGCGLRKQYRTCVKVGLRRYLHGLKLAAFVSWVGYFKRRRHLRHQTNLWQGCRRFQLLRYIFKRWPAYLEVLRARKQQEEAQAAHAAEIAATHRQYAEKEELVIEQVHAQVEAAHLAASRLLQRNTMRRIDWLRFKWVWKHWQQIWHLATVKRDRASVEHLHATTVAVQRTRAERDRVAYEQKLREVKKEAHRAEKWAHELQRAGCPLCDASATVVGQTRTTESFAGRQQMPQAGGRQVLVDGGQGQQSSQVWAGHRDDPGLKHHLHPARGSVLVDTVALPKGNQLAGPPDVPQHHLIMLK